MFHGLHIAVKNQKQRNLNLIHDVCAVAAAAAAVAAADAAANYISYFLWNDPISNYDAAQTNICKLKKNKR